MDCSISELVRIVKKTYLAWKGFSEWITNDKTAVVITPGNDSLYSSAMYMLSRLLAVISCDSWKVWMRASAMSVASTA